MAYTNIGGADWTDSVYDIGINWQLEFNKR